MEWELLPRAVPIIAQFVHVNGSPCADKIVSRSRQIALVNRARFNFDQCLMLHKSHENAWEDDLDNKNE